MSFWDQPSAAVAGEGVDHSALITASHVDDLSFAGNIVEHPGQYMKKAEAIGPDVTQHGAPEGITIHQAR
jgi:hypothetical protein